jgi:nicastrin
LISQNSQKLQNSGKLAGLVLIRGNATGQFSLDSRTPNSKNPKGFDLLSKQIPFPIFEISSLKQDNSTIALELALEYNRDRSYAQFPLYGMQFMLPMWAIRNSDLCLKRKHCTPIQEQSIWSSFSDIVNEETPIIVVSTKIDSNALFRDQAFGHSVRTGPVLLMAIASALSTIPMSTLPKSVLFSFFGAESWGHAGSQRFVQDITQDFVCKSKQATPKCQFGAANSCTNPCHSSTDFANLKFERIDSIIDIDTVGSLYADPSTSTAHYVHIDRPSVSVDSLVQTILSNFTVPVFEGSTSVPANILSARDDLLGLGLPPSPAMAFLAKKRNIPAVVVSDYKSEFSNP